MSDADAFVEDSEPAGSQTSEDPRFVVDVQGFEGPLDLLLSLAREQKVDLAQISILALAEQYLEFVEKIRRSRIDLAADYLVMAAWLAYLKSRLLLPDPHQDEDEEPTGEELAALLQFKLRRLEAIRAVAQQLIQRPRAGEAFFFRPQQENVDQQTDAPHPGKDVSLYDLLKAYVIQRQKTVIQPIAFRPRVEFTMQEAEEILHRLIGDVAIEWSSLQDLVAQYFETDAERADVIAASFVASLEMAKSGTLELQQSDALSPIYLRAKQEKTS